MTVEPTRMCIDCERRKPWSEFHAESRWPDGSMRAPRSVCRRCQVDRARRWAQRNRDRRIEIQRRWWAKHKQAVNARRRERYREVRRPSPRVDVGPFREWLLSIRDRYQTFAVMADSLGLQERQLRAILKGEQAYVLLDTVDRAVLREDRTLLDELYPLEVAA